MGNSLNMRKRIGLELFKELYASKVKEHKLSTLFWECTLRCNLSCRHCGSDCKTLPAIKDMPKEDFFKVLDECITPNVETEKLLIILSGGEVLVREDLEEIGKGLYNRRYPWGMVTNGLALTRKRLDSLLQSGLRSITVSLDGLAEDHLYMRQNEKSFERAVNAIKMIVAEPTLAFDVVSCVNQCNLKNMTALKEFLISIGVKNWRIFTIFPAGRAASDPTLLLDNTQFKELMEFIIHTRKEGRIHLDYACEGFLGNYETEVRDNFYQCSAGVSVASIRVDGAISGCTSIRANFNQGNIYKDNFWDVWQNRFQEFRNREWARKDECATCKMFKFCQGGGMHLRDENKKLFVCHYKKTLSL